MCAVDLNAQFSDQHLGSRPIPRNLQILLELQRKGTSQLRTMGITFLESNRLPRLIESECEGRDDLEGIVRASVAGAMRDMSRMIGFVGEFGEGNALGYWFGPDHLSIETAPLISFGEKDRFSIIPGQGIVEAVLVVASAGSAEKFGGLRKYLENVGLSVLAPTLADIRQPHVSTSPQTVYQQLIQSYRADLSAAFEPDAGSPVNIMTTHR